MESIREKEQKEEEEFIKHLRKKVDVVVEREEKDSDAQREALRSGKIDVDSLEKIEMEANNELFEEDVHFETNESESGEKEGKSSDSQKKHPQKLNEKSQHFPQRAGNWDFGEESNMSAMFSSAEQTDNSGSCMMDRLLFLILLRCAEREEKGEQHELLGEVCESGWLRQMVCDVLIMTRRGEAAEDDGVERANEEVGFGRNELEQFNESSGDSAFVQKTGERNKNNSTIALADFEYDILRSFMSDMHTRFFLLSLSLLLLHKAKPLPFHLLPCIYAAEQKIIEESQKLMNKKESQSSSSRQKLKTMQEKEGTLSSTTSSSSPSPSSLEDHSMLSSNSTAPSFEAESEKDQNEKDLTDASLCCKVLSYLCESEDNLIYVDGSQLLSSVITLLTSNNMATVVAALRFLVTLSVHNNALIKQRLIEQNILTVSSSLIDSEKVNSCEGENKNAISLLLSELWEALLKGEENT